jgi:hypothetical protein
VPRILINIVAAILAWNFPTEADWFYRLLVSSMVLSVVTITLNLALSPLAVIFWVIDSRYPLKTRFLDCLRGLLCGGVWVAIEFGILWFLLTQHVGNSGSLRTLGL